MREIKFRAWDKVGKHMYFSFPIVSHGETNIFMLSSLIEAWTKGNYELMQFTGLLDKNGKEIYEGDIVTHPYHWEENHVIKWPEDYYDIQEYALDSEDMKVIGNIYENPELIEKT